MSAVPAYLGRDSRVLLLVLEQDETVAKLLAALPAGVLIVLGNAEQVREARQRFASHENAMFHAATPEEIPWRDEYFDIVIAPALPLSSAAIQEAVRVLASGGYLVGLLEAAAEFLSSAGLQRITPDTWQKIASSRPRNPLTVLS